MLVFINVVYIFQTDSSSPPLLNKHLYTNSKFENHYNSEEQHQIYNQINNNQPHFNSSSNQQEQNHHSRNKRSTVARAVPQQNTPQLRKHLMYNQHQQNHASNSINYNNNQNHYQRQQSFDHYSPLLIADDQQKQNQFDKTVFNHHQIQYHSMNGKKVFLFSAFVPFN